MYASPDVGPVLADLMASESAPAGPRQLERDRDGGRRPRVRVQDPEVPEELLEAFEDFEGAAATVRFADGGVELEMAGRRPEKAMMTRAVRGGRRGRHGRHAARRHRGRLRRWHSPEGWAQALLDTLPSYGIPQEQIDQGLAQAEAQTGLSLPEDLETLLGEQFALAFGGDFDIERWSTPATRPGCRSA